MARFKVPSKRTAWLKFSDGDYAGAEVLVSLSASVGLYLAMSEGLEGPDSDTRLLELMKRFGRELLIEWNLEDNDGNEIPATAEGMLQIPAEFSSVIISTWLEAWNPSAPLAQPSSDGTTSPEESTTTAKSSENLPRSRKQRRS